MDNVFSFLFSVIFCYASGQFGPPPKIKPVAHDIQFSRPSDKGVMYNYHREFRTDTVEITWVNSTTSSIAIRWNFVKHYAIKGIFEGSEVEYFVPGGKFISQRLSKRYEFVLRNLIVATTYTVCVTMYEDQDVDAVNGSLVMHSHCLKLDTIPYIRRDSLATLILVICYFLFMTLMGYFQWKRRVIELRNQKPYQTVEVSENNQDSSVRWKDVEERQRLYLPGTSIEET